MKRFFGSIAFGLLSIIAAIGIAVLLIILCPLLGVFVACMAAFQSPWLWEEPKARGRKGVRS